MRKWKNDVKNRIFLNNSRGFTMLFGVVLLVMSVLIGITLLMTARADRIASVDVKKIRSAAVGANASLRASEGFFLSKPLLACTLLTNFRKDNSKCWLFGKTASDASSETRVYIDTTNKKGSPSYSAKLVAYDSITQTIEILGKGYGFVEGTKEVRGVYQLSGIQWAMGSGGGGSGQIYAMFLAGDGRDINTRVDINGDCYLGGSFTFNSSADSSVIRGNLKAGFADTGKWSLVQERIFVKGWAVFQSKVKFSRMMTIDDNAFFGDSVFTDANPLVSIKKNAYFNRPIVGNQKIEMNNGNVAYYGSTGFDTLKLQNAASKTKFTTPLAIETYFSTTSGNDSSCKFDTMKLYNVANPAYIMNVDTMKGMTNITGKILQGKYDTLKNLNRLWNNFMVIRLNGNISMLSNAYKFKGKVIWIVQNTINTNGHWYSCTDSSCTIVYVVNNGRVNDVGVDSGNVFRGLFFVEGTGTVTYRWSNDTLRGILYHTNPSAALSTFQMNAPVVTEKLFIKPNVDVIKLARDTLGLLVPPGGSVGLPAYANPVINNLELIDVKIRPTLLSVYY